MKATLIFVFLQFVMGYAFAIGGFLLGDEIFNLDGFNMTASIIFSSVLLFICMLAGVITVGYFHLRVKNNVFRFGTAILLSIAGLILFLLIYFLLEDFIPQEFRVLFTFLPLTGAVFGFNLVATHTARRVPPFPRHHRAKHQPT